MAVGGNYFPFCFQFKPSTGLNEKMGDNIFSFFTYVEGSGFNKNYELSNY